jgi:hypothetical protein
VLFALVTITSSLHYVYLAFCVYLPANAAMLSAEWNPVVVELFQALGFYKKKNSINAFNFDIGRFPRQRIPHSRNLLRM